MAKQKTKTCQGNDCIFCCSVCPECGSNNIEVNFKPILEYKNDASDKIVINYEGSGKKGVRSFKLTT